MRTRPILLGAALLLSVLRPAAAQQLDPVVERFAEAWARGDADAVAALAASGGVTLELETGSVGPVGSRQAAAALRRVFDGRETVALRRSAARLVGDPPSRAFGELEWSVRSRGTRIPETTRVFFALVREEAGWRVTQIRLMR